RVVMRSSFAIRKRCKQRPYGAAIELHRECRKITAGCHESLPRSGLVQSALCGAPHKAEIGAAWSKRSEEGRDYLSLKLDDPSFTAPIYANLFDDEGGEGYTLLWSRPRKNGE
ncbi:MAG TPA: DUF736 domain-containing protein, partial [Candidatus Sulfotelmatobacter sp.]|nr:DUF736 domain-containing protein [Candidatus Sulfotelmatobacter sp.]